MMKNYDESVKINSNQNWSNIPDHPYKILIIGGFGSCKTNVTEFNKTSTIRYWQNLYVKDPFKSKYQLLINGREKIGIENLKNLKAFIDYSQTNYVYENLEDYNLTIK